MVVEPEKSKTADEGVNSLVLYSRVLVLDLFSIPSQQHLRINRYIVDYDFLVFIVLIIRDQPVVIFIQSHGC